MEPTLIAAALKSRKACDRIFTFGLDDISDKGRIILKQIAKYYLKDEEADHCDTDLIISALGRKYPKHKESFEAAIRFIPDVNGISVENVLDELLSLRKETIALELSQAFAKQNHLQIEQLLPKWERLGEPYEEGTDEEEDGAELIHNIPITRLLEVHKQNADRIKMAPRQLSEYLEGGCQRQDHVVVFGRPEIAKTTFIINLIYGFVHQGLKVLFVNNEDPYIKLMLRFYQRVTGWTRSAIEADPEGAHKVMEEKAVYGSLTLYSVPDGTLEDIENLVAKQLPDVVVVDQMRNIRTPNQDNRVEQLEEIARKLRQIARKYNLLMVSTTQAGDSAHNKKVLDMGDVDWSNTGIQGAADLMIGIGADEMMKDRGQRCLSFPKNKISGRREPILAVFDTENVKVT